MTDLLLNSGNHTYLHQWFSTSQGWIYLPEPEMAAQNKSILQEHIQNLFEKVKEGRTIRLQCNGRTNRFRNSEDVIIIYLNLHASRVGRQLLNTNQRVLHSQQCILHFVWCVQGIIHYRSITNIANNAKIQNGLLLQATHDSLVHSKSPTRTPSRNKNLTMLSKPQTRSLTMNNINASGAVVVVVVVWMIQQQHYSNGN